jgi:hypothetical protein
MDGIEGKKCPKCFKLTAKEKFFEKNKLVRVCIPASAVR